MSSALVEAVDVTVKYDTKLSTGQTRRERAAGFGMSSPAVVVPDYASQVWKWFWDIRHTKSNYTEPMTYPDLQAWAIMSGNLVSSRECDMMMRMDASFRSAAAIVAKQDEELMSRYKGKK